VVNNPDSGARGIAQSNELPLRPAQLPSQRLYKLRSSTEALLEKFLENVHEGMAGRLHDQLTNSLASPIPGGKTMSSWALSASSSDGGSLSPKNILLPPDPEVFAREENGCIAL
jgi:hypothetical protein